MAKYLDQGAAPRFVTAGKKRRYVHSSTSQAASGGAKSAEQEDAGAGDRSKATCSTASGEHAPHSLSFVPLELYSSSSPSTGPAQPSKGSE